MELNNDELYKKHDQLVELKRETYEKLYNRCKNRIKLTSDAGELLCLFEIPSFMFGCSYPIINVRSCANYIMNKLYAANKHIKSAFIEPNILFIDWRRKSDINNIKFATTQKNISHSPSSSDRKRSVRTISSSSKVLSTTGSEFRSSSNKTTDQ